MKSHLCGRDCSCLVLTVVVLNREVPHKGFNCGSPQQRSLSPVDGIVVIGFNFIYRFNCGSPQKRNPTSMDGIVAIGFNCGSLQ